MEITYLGHSSFKLKSKGGMTLVMDPFDSSKIGLNFAKDTADILTISHDHPGHNARNMITGPVSREKTFVIDKVGEYEIGGVEISAIGTYHDKTEGKERGKNILTFVRMDGLSIVHLGDLGTKLSDSQIEKIGTVDVLMVPVGGVSTIDLDTVEDLIKDIQPSYIIPMHFKDEKMIGPYAELGELSKFLEKNKFPMAGESQHKVKVDLGSLPDDTQVLLMHG